MLAVLGPVAVFAQNRPVGLPEPVRVLLDSLPPLRHDRGDRSLLYQYSVGDLSGLSDSDTRKVIRVLAERGVGVITFWEKGDERDLRIEEGIRIARIQHELGLRVAVDATRLLYRFYDGTGQTAHVDENGEPFFDRSFGDQPMGCPFTLRDRVPVIRSRITAYVEAYRSAGVPIDIVTADWEIDGPHEWNRAWINAKRCVRCRAHLPNIDDFGSFQATLRSLRSRLLRDSYTRPVLRRHPGASVTNYAVYPNDGRRYWYDYFESPQPDLPHTRDQGALYRPWYDEFTETEFTMAMPVVYTWYPVYRWYPDYSPDYRWFYNMLKVGSNAGSSTPSGIPIATFLHWHTTAPPEHPDPDVKQMSRRAYRELVWHLLMRGHDLLFNWCRREEIAGEMRLLQQVYDESLEYSDWLQWGRPVSFKVPREESSVVSGLKWGDRVLVRRTDFGDPDGPVRLKVEGGELVVPSKPGKNQVLDLEP